MYARWASISGIWIGFATEAVNLCWNQNNYTWGSEICRHICWKGCKLLCLCQPAETAARESTQRTAGEWADRSCSSCSVAGSWRFAAGHPQYSLSRTDDTKECFRWWCLKGGLESIPSKTLIHCLRLLLMPSRIVLFRLLPLGTEAERHFASNFLIFAGEKGRGSCRKPFDKGNCTASKLSDRHVVQSIKSDSEDLPRVNPEDVEDLEWISQSLGVSLRFVTQTVLVKINEPRQQVDLPAAHASSCLPLDLLPLAFLRFFHYLWTPFSHSPFCFLMLFARFPLLRYHHLNPVRFTDSDTDQSDVGIPRSRKR